MKSNNFKKDNTTSAKKIILIILVLFLIFLIYNKSIGTNKNNDKLKGWNNLTVKSSEVFTTNNWIDYNANDNFEKFSIAFPENWKLNGGVFNNEKDLKIAEFSPGLVDLEPNQNCFDTPWEDFYGDSELISQSDIKIGLLKGKLTIEKAEAWNGITNNEYWYPHIYCLSNGNRAFVATFYERTLKSNNKELYNKILSTLVF